jgi:two-component system, OmpR family, phosphate regulon response regulator PhoB
MAKAWKKLRLSLLKSGIWRDKRFKAMNALIYVVEDEADLALLLRYNLEKNGFRVETLTCGDEAELRIKEQKPDLILLDWMLPKISGIELCRRLKARKDTKAIPLIMLTARSEEQDKIQGLNTGADDYVVKPFSINELLARVKALLRRSNPALIAEQLVFEGLILQKQEKWVKHNDKILHLGPLEFKLLQLFMAKPKQVYTREQITTKIWGEEAAIDERTVDVHIGRLRKALNEGFETKYIRTVRGAGYALVGEI